MGRVKDQSRQVIGWREWVALPGLGIEAIKAKVDTGAATSSLHAVDVEEFRRGARRMVRFKVHPEQRHQQPAIAAEAPLLGLRSVRPSTGRAERRPVIAAVVEIGGDRFDVELTLTRRDEMGFRMLLGRQAMRGRYVVDPGRSWVAGKRPGPEKRKRRARRP